MKVWILTESYNAYDQYGEYFVEVYAEKPTVEKLMLATESNYAFCEWLLNSGGGHKNPWEKNPYSWYHLRQVNCE